MSAVDGDEAKRVGDEGEPSDPVDDGTSEEAPKEVKQPPVWTPKALDEVVRISGEVVHGLGRGSKMLGIPTANVPAQAIEDSNLAADAADGVYFGFAAVGSGPVYKTVLSIGWNPFFKNKHRTVEPYLMNEFKEDFYGQTLHLLVCGFLRSQADFANLDDLVAAIHKDIDVASALLDTEEYSHLRSDSIFTTSRS